MWTMKVAVVAAMAVAASCGDDAQPSDTRDVTDATDFASEPDIAPEVDAPLEDATPEVDAIVVPADRAPGVRAPLTGRCDASEPARCFLPWPSSVFLTTDATKATGVRVTVAHDELAADEGMELLDGADGFSRVSPIVALLPHHAPTEGVLMRVFVAEPGAAFATEVPIDTLLVPGRDGDDRDVLVGYPQVPLRAASEHLVIVEGAGLGAFEDGKTSAHAAEVAFGKVAPVDQDEADRYARFAPARTIVAARGIDTTEVYALWDFITRSADDARMPLRTLAESVKAQIDDRSATIAITSAVPRDGSIAIVVEGTIAGLVDRLPQGPTFPAAPDSQPITYSVPFRVVVPAGTGDYRIVMYGHGTGGNVHDGSFDDLISRSGAAKVNTEIDGWSEDTVIDAVSSLLVPIAGTRDLTARMRRSIAGIAAIQHAVLGPLGELLAAPMILAVPNPAVGRRPSSDKPIWAGGSLGGVIGCVYSHLEPTIVGGVLNVPGAAFTHWLARSSIGVVLNIALAGRYPAMVDQQVAASMAQAIWDEVDGAIWAGARDPAPVFVLQMSVGDPIMPNNGTAMVATALNAVMLVPDGIAPLVPIAGLEPVTEAVGRTGLTEYVTNETATTDIHGFAARAAPAGVAARAQFEAFIATLWAGSPRIVIPDACEDLPQPGICDFSEVPLTP